MRSAALSMFLCGWLASPVHAQENDIVVLPTITTEEGAEAAGALAAALETELRARGAALIGPGEAKRRFENAHSSDPAAPEQDAFDELAQCTEEVLVLTASQQVGRARALGRECLGLAEAALETLNRRTDAAQQVLDGCLYGVRAILDAHRLRQSSDGEREAAAEVRRCRALVPDLPATMRMHHPEILEALARVDEELRQSRSELRVTSNSPGCAVYLNGRRLGATPFLRGSLPGSVYRVQVECDGAPGRVHRVQLGSGSLTLHVDEEFDGAIFARSDRLQLVYDERSQGASRRLDDARTIAEAVRADELWLLAHEEDARWRVDRVRARDGHVFASVRLSAQVPRQGFDRDAGSRAVALLLEGRSRDLSGVREAALDPWAAPGQAEGAAEPTAHLDAPAPTGPGTEPHFANWLIGGGLIAGGIGALISPIWTLATEGECLEHGPVGCQVRVHFDEVSGVLMGVGIAAILGGAAFMWAAPIRVQVGVDPTSARLWMTGEF